MERDNDAIEFFDLFIFAMLVVNVIFRIILWFMENVFCPIAFRPIAGSLYIFILLSFEGLNYAAWEAAKRFGLGGPRELCFYIVTLVMYTACPAIISALAEAESELLVRLDCTHKHLAKLLRMLAWIYTIFMPAVAGLWLVAGLPGLFSLPTSGDLLPMAHHAAIEGWWFILILVGGAIATRISRN